MSITDSEVRRNSCGIVLLSCLFSLASLDLTSLWLVFGCPKLLIRRGSNWAGGRKGVGGEKDAMTLILLDTH